MDRDGPSREALTSPRIRLPASILIRAFWLYLCCDRK